MPYGQWRWLQVPAISSQVAADIDAVRSVNQARELGFPGRHVDVGIAEGVSQIAAHDGVAIAVKHEHRRGRGRHGGQDALRHLHARELAEGIGAGERDGGATVWPPGVGIVCRATAWASEKNAPLWFRSYLAKTIVGSPL